MKKFFSFIILFLFVICSYSKEPYDIIEKKIYNKIKLELEQELQDITNYVISFTLYKPNVQNLTDVIFYDNYHLYLENKYVCDSVLINKLNNIKKNYKDKKNYKYIRYFYVKVSYKKKRNYDYYPYQEDLKEKEKVYLIELCKNKSDKYSIFYHISSIRNMLLCFNHISYMYKLDEIL